MVETEPVDDNAVLNIASTLRFSVWSASMADTLAIGGCTYGALYPVAGVCTIVAAMSIVRLRSVR